MSASRVIPIFNHTPHTEEYIAKTHPMDLPMEEHISTRDPSDFQKSQSHLQDIFQPPWIFTSILHLIP